MSDSRLRGILPHLDRASRELGRRRDNRIVRGLARIARPFVHTVDGAARSYDMSVNGEAWLLGRVAPGAVVLDVGANVVEWSEIAIDRGAAAVHAFEILPATADTFAANLGGSDRVALNRIGLGSEPGSVTVHYYPDNPALTTTATAFPHSLPHDAVVVDVITGDQYLESTDIDRVDLLKIDVEGEEPNVLRGFLDALGAGRVGVIQFEYGVVAALSRFLIIDFYELLEPLGFEIGPLLPDHVDFQPYNLSLERFEYVNWVAVHSSRPDLRSKLSPG